MRTTTLVMAIAGVAAAASVASADIIAQIQVIAHDEQGVEIGQHTWVAPVTPDGSGGWGNINGVNSNPWILGSGPNAAVVHGVSFSWLNDPQVTANFNVSSGPANTTFTINSSFLSFSTISGAIGVASAAVGVTDSATFGDAGSVNITGLQPGGSMFSARYNGSSQTFADLVVGGLTTGLPGLSQAFTGTNASFPGYDLVPGGSASDMQSQFRFTLSRFDRAVGTSTFEIIPAPGAASLLGLGALLAGRRRRA